MVLSRPERPSVLRERRRVTPTTRTPRGRPRRPSRVRPARPRRSWLAAARWAEPLWSVAVDEVAGQRGAERARRDARAVAAAAVGVARDLDPQLHLRAAAELGRRAQLALR